MRDGKEFADDVDLLSSDDVTKFHTHVQCQQIVMMLEKIMVTDFFAYFAVWSSSTWRCSVVTVRLVVGYIKSGKYTVSCRTTDHSFAQCCSKDMTDETL